RTYIAIEAALVVLRGNHGEKVRPIRENMKRRFFALQEFFDDEFRSGLAKCLRIHELVDRGPGLSRILRDHNTFAGSETVAFDHDGVAESAELVIGLVSR